MRTRSDRRHVRWVLVTAGAAAALIAGGAWPAAEATSSREHHLEDMVRSPAGRSRKLMAVEELRTTDSTDARNRLKDLADSADERAALLAISALGRCDWSGARTKLEHIYEDEDRSDAVRAAALTVIAAGEARAGHPWSRIRHWVKEKAGENEALRDQRVAAKARYWANESEVDDE